MKQYSIVGQKHRGKAPYLEGVTPGTRVVLVREPDNQYDPNAIRVEIADEHVGYIPKAQNAALAQYIDQVGATHAPSLALDGSLRRCITATFARSPNSAYPMVEVNSEIG